MASNGVNIHSWFRKRIRKRDGTACQIKLEWFEILSFCFEMLVEFPIGKADNGNCVLMLCIFSFTFLWVLFVFWASRITYNHQASARSKFQIFCWIFGPLNSSHRFVDERNNWQHQMKLIRVNNMPRIWRKSSPLDSESTCVDRTRPFVVCYVEGL